MKQTSKDSSERPKIFITSEELRKKRIERIANLLSDAEEFAKEVVAEGITNIRDFGDPNRFLGLTLKFNQIMDEVSERPESEGGLVNDITAGLIEAGAFILPTKENLYVKLESGEDARVIDFRDSLDKFGINPFRFLAVVDETLNKFEKPVV